MADNKSKPIAVNGVEVETMADDSRDEEYNKVTRKIPVETETEAENDDWIPDGGWGWGVVAGAVMVHVYAGKTFFFIHHC